MAVGVGQNAREFDCHTCGYKHCDEDGRLPGSRGKAGYDAWQLDGVNYRVCPMMQITPMSRQFMMLHTHYAKRLLPFHGGLMNQPNAYLQAMETIESKIHV